MGDLRDELLLDGELKVLGGSMGEDVGVMMVEAGETRWAEEGETDDG